MLLSFLLTWASLLWLWDLPSMRTVLRAVSSCFRVWVLFFGYSQRQHHNYGILSGIPKTGGARAFLSKSPVLFWYHRVVKVGKDLQGHGVHPVPDPHLVP